MPQDVVAKVTTAFFNFCTLEIKRISWIRQYLAIKIFSELLRGANGNLAVDSLQ